MTVKRVNGIERALDILECLSRLNRPATRIEIVTETGMPRSTVYALTDLLRERGWVVEDDQGLLLGPHASFASNTYLHQQSFERRAREVLSELAVETGNLCEIDVVDNWEHVAVVSEGHLASGYLRPVEGSRIPLMPTAAARILLADLPEDLIRRNIPASAMVDVRGESLSWDRFFHDMKIGQLQGYIAVDGWLGGLASTLACPILGKNQVRLGSLCLIIQSSTAAPHLAVNLPPLMQAAQKLSDLLKHIPWPYAENCKSSLLSSERRTVF